MTSKAYKSILFFLILGLSLAVHVLPLQDPLAIDLESRFEQPGVHHLLGTDELGRDLMSRVIHGTATTLSVSMLALLSSLGIGILLGGIAGYCYNGWFDKGFNWTVSLIFSLPFILVMVSLMSFMGSGIFNAYLILSLLMWVNPGRIVRAEVIRTRKMLFVTASRAYGMSECEVLFKCILPGCVKSGILFSIGYFPEVIGLEAGLSFLGMGVQPPEPGLGKMIFDGLNYLYSAWWISFFPATAIALIVWSINRIVSHDTPITNRLWWRC